MKNLSFDETLKIFFKYIEINGKIPSLKEIYMTHRVGAWYKSCRGRIKNKEDNIYINLSKNTLVKENIDNYLKKDKKKNFKFDESLNVLLKFINLNGKMPKREDIYLGCDIYMWLNTQKNYITNKDDELYILLSSKHELIKKNLNKYLEKKENSK